MSSKSSFKAALARQAAAKELRPALSSSPTVQVVLKANTIERPVDFARSLAAYGVPLKKANNILNRLAMGEAVPVELGGDLVEIAKAFANLGVSVRAILDPQANAKQVRERSGLSQAEFAVLYCMELPTLQNWEQGRHSPDRFAQLLLKVIERYPHVVEAVVTESIEGDDFLGDPAKQDAPASPAERTLHPKSS